jgi:hypothetical protein
MNLIQLPQLVKENIENYLYLSKWKENIVKLNQEYREKVVYYEYPSVISLIWKKRRQRICDLEIKTSFHLRYKSTILSWKTSKLYFMYSKEENNLQYLKRPKNYYFSSGLNYNLGYKNAPVRFYYSRYAIDVYGD